VIVNEIWHCIPLLMMSGGDLASFASLNTWLILISAIVGVKNPKSKILPLFE
jgi:hypothetical protein